jgi:hypothetical protein
LSASLFSSPPPQLDRAKADKVTMLGAMKDRTRVVEFITNYVSRKLSNSAHRVVTSSLDREHGMVPRR